MRSSEITLALLLLHRGRFVGIDQAALPLGNARRFQLVDDVFHGTGARFDRAAQRIAAERTEPNVLDLGLVAVFERQAIVVHHDQHAVTVNHRPRCCEIERDD